MGLMGLARRAGRARGAYMAAQEDYHRQRQAMLDQQLMDQRRQQMGIAAAGERRAQAAFDLNQGWLAKERANTEQGWKRNAEKFGWDKAAEARKQAKFEQNQKAAAAKLDAVNAAQTQRKQVWDMMSDDERIAAVYPYSRYAGLPGMAGANSANTANNRLDRPNKTYRQNAGTDGATREAGIGAGKPPVSDTLLKANAEAVKPSMIQMAFDQQFYDTDENIQKRTGMKRSELIAALADQYRAHILSARENAMNIDDFIYQAVKKYGFVDRDDLGGLMTAMSQNKGNFGLGLYGISKRNTVKNYEKRNPAFYKQRRALIDEVSAIEGLEPKTVNYALRNPEFVRKYRKARERLSPSEAFQAVSEAFRNRAGMQQASSNGAQSARPSAPVPTRLPFSDDSELTGLPPLSDYERLRMHRDKRFLSWFQNAKDNGYDIDRARRYAEYQYRRGA